MSSETPPAEAEESPEPKKSRSPVERAIVWGGIVALVAVVCVEARAKFGYDNSRVALANALEDNEAAQVSLAEARTLMVLSPAVFGPVKERINHVYTFSWFSLFKSGQYEIALTTTREDDPQVLNFTTADAPAPQPIAPVIAAPEGDEAEMFADGSGEGFGAGGGRPPRPDPLVRPLDADEDGEISTDEMDNASAALLALDADGDGQLTREELFPEGARFGGRAGNGQSNDGDSGRPQRPELEE